MDMKIAELTITFDRLMLKTEIKREIDETKKMMRGQKWDDVQHMYLDGYLNGLRIALCFLEEMKRSGNDEVSE
jgi:hypothetical protein